LCCESFRHCQDLKNTPDKKELTQTPRKSSHCDWQEHDIPGESQAAETVDLLLPNGSEICQEHNSLNYEIIELDQPIIQEGLKVKIDGDQKDVFKDNGKKISNLQLV